MKNETKFAKLGLLAGAVALIATGCASSGVARYDSDSASGTEVAVRADTDNGIRADADLDDASGRPQAVSTLSFVPITAAKRVGAWPAEWNVRANEIYTFVVPATDVQVSANLPSYSDDLPNGSVFSEAAGGESGAYRVIRHSPNPR